MFPKSKNAYLYSSLTGRVAWNLVNKLLPNIFPELTSTTQTTPIFTSHLGWVISNLMTFTLVWLWLVLHKSLAQYSFKTAPVQNIIQRKNTSKPDHLTPPRPDQAFRHSTTLCSSPFSIVYPSFPPALPSSMNLFLAFPGLLCSWGSLLFPFLSCAPFTS